MQSFDENKELLRSLYAEAKSLGETANAARNQVNELKVKKNSYRDS